MTPSSPALAASETLHHESYRASALVTLLRLRWFIHLRWIMMAVAAVILLIEPRFVPGVHRPAGLWYVIAAIGVVNIGWSVLSHLLRVRFREDEDTEQEAIRSARIFANAQVAIDLLLLTMILRYTGGVESPMAIFYVFHMAIGSLLLTTWQAVVQGIWAVALYAGLAWAELRGAIEHYAFLPSLSSALAHTQPAFVVTAVVVLACGLFGTLYFTLGIAARLDAREAQLRQALENLQASQKAIRELQLRRSRFMQTAAHQLKSPLTGIEMLAGLIRDGIVQGSDVQETTEKIARRCREGVAAVTELLTLARLQDADPERHGRALADVADIARDVCQRRQLQADQQHILLTCDTPENVNLNARVERADLSDCLDNLVENAIKYSPDGSEVRVSVERRSAAPTAGTGDVIAFSWTHNSAAVPAEWIAISVQDTGMGIDLAELKSADAKGQTGTLFDAFRRGNAALTAGIPGSGLGLSIVRTIVEQTGGRITVQSEPGKGTTFTVMFPAAGANGAEKRHATDTTVGASQEKPQSR